MQNIATSKRRGRPPKTELQRDEIRASLIRAGTVALTEYNFSLAGIDGILRQVGVPKGSFYQYFDSKEHFGLAILDDYAGYFAHKLNKTLGNKSLAPLDRVRAFKENVCESMARFQFKRGCIVGNMAQEIGGIPEVFRARLDGIIQDWQALLASCLWDAVASGELSESADCDELAEFFWTGWEGAVMRAKLRAERTPLDIFVRNFLAGLPR